MKNGRRWFGLVSALLVGLTTALPAKASSEWGPMLANNILGGAATGALVGLSSGTLAYGLDHNYNSQYLLTGLVYGVLGGAVTGGGVGVYEISTQLPDTGLTVFNYGSGGLGLGAFFGGVVAILPFMRDGNPADFTIGIGLGGLIGASLGLVVAGVDIHSRAPESGRSLTGRIGVMDVSSVLPSLVPDQAAEPILNCKLVQVTF